MERLAVRHVVWLVTFGLLAPLVAAAVPSPAPPEGPLHAAEGLLFPSAPEAPVAPSQRLAAALAARDAPTLATVALQAAGASDELVAAATGGPSLGLAAGDLTGDARADALLLSWHIGTETFSLAGLAGEDGATLWSRAWPGLDALAPFAVPDATGDGRDDVLVLTFAMTTPKETVRCALLACVVRTTWTHAWGLSLLSGATGEEAWTRAWPGSASVTLVDSFIGGIYRSYDAWNVSLFLAPPGLGDAWALTATAYDVEERGLFANVASRGEALGRAGTVVLARASSGSPDVGFLFPAGDAVGDAGTDIVWEIDRLLETPGPRPYGTTVEMIDGGTLATAWRRDLDGPASPILLPAGADLDGDARADLLLWTYGYVDVLSGAQGTRPWAEMRPGLPYATPPMDGGSGSDLMLVTYDDPQGYLVWTFDRVDGATGALLSSTSPRFASYRASATGFAVVEDRIHLVHLYMDDAGYRTTWRVEDAASGEALLLDDRAGIQAMLLVGDIDADGGWDLARMTLDFFAPEGFAYRLAPLDGAAERWALREAYPSLPGLYATTGVDLAGGPGADVLLTVIRQQDGHVAARVRALDGATGAVAWERNA